MIIPHASPRLLLSFIDRMWDEPFAPGVWVVLAVVGFAALYAAWFVFRHGRREVRTGSVCMRSGSVRRDERPLAYYFVFAGKYVCLVAVLGGLLVLLAAKAIHDLLPAMND